MRTFALFAALAAAETQHAQEVKPPNATAQTASETEFRKAGKGAAMTVTPTVTAGKPIAKVGEVVAMMLERSGMSNLETSAVAFTPPKDADLDATAAAFAAFVKANPPTTDYILFTEFRGAPSKGVREIFAVVAAKNGEIVWKDRQAPGDKDFDRIKPREPLPCCLLVAERLRPVLGLSRPSQGSAEGGKIAQRWRRESGVPDKAEWAAIEARGKALKKAAANSSLVVYPIRAGGSFSGESAAAVAATLNERKLTNAKPAGDGPRIEAAGDINEQKVLWAMARAFSDHVAKNPPDADYVLFADYLMGKDRVGAVHFAICNRKGELVVVDYQNNHHKDFNAINPKTREDCDRLLFKRLEGIVR